MEGRKWEGLEIDCLTNILGRVGTESLLLDIPFVCKSWLRASLEPTCWENIDIPGWAPLFTPLWSRFEEEYKIKDFTVRKLIKLVVNRSTGRCTVLHISCGFNEDLLPFFAEKCPSLRRLSFHWMPCKPSSFLPGLIKRWKHLEHLGLPRSKYFTEILNEINLNCKKFSSLHVFNHIGSLEEEEVTAIVTYVPNVKYLYLRGLIVEKLLTILLIGCRELEHLEVGSPGCFKWKLDEKTLKLASHIKTFIYK